MMRLVEPPRVPVEVWPVSHRLARWASKDCFRRIELDYRRGRKFSSTGLFARLVDWTGDRLSYQLHDIEPT